MELKKNIDNFFYKGGDECFRGRKLRPFKWAQLKACSNEVFIF